MGTSKHKEYIRDLIYTQVEEKIEFFQLCSIPTFIEYQIKNNLYYADIHKILDELVEEGFIKYERDIYYNHLDKRISKLYVVTT